MIKKKSKTLYQTLFLCSIFVISRIIYYTFFKVKFDSSSLARNWQYIDVPLLQNKLLESIFYLHSQPPLYNFFLGIILKLFPTNYTFAFGVVSFVLGLILTICLFLLLLRFKINDKLSILLVILFMLSPSIILFENWLQYAYMIGVILCASALFLHKFISDKKTKDGIIFFSLMALIIYIRGTYHLLWFVLMVIILLFFQRKNWKKILIVCSIPLILILALYVKNAIVFGTFSCASSHIGQNLIVISTFSLPKDLRQSLVEKGELSEFSLISQFSPISKYQSLIEIKKTGIDILDQEKKVNGVKSVHHLAYIQVSKHYLKDAIYVIKNYPSVYLKKLKAHYKGYFKPASGKFKRRTRSRKEPNYRKLKPIINTYDFLGFNNLRLRKIGFQAVLLYSLILTLIFIIKYFNKKPQDLAQNITILFMVLTILMIAIGTILVSWGNHSRHRFNTDSFYLILTALLMTAAFNKTKSLIKKIKKTGEKDEKNNNPNYLHITNLFYSNTDLPPKYRSKSYVRIRLG